MDLIKYKVSLDLIGKEDEMEQGEEKKPKGWKKIAMVPNPAIRTIGMAFEEEQTHEMFFADDVKMRIAAPISIPMDIPRKPIKGFNNDEPFIAEITCETIEESVKHLMQNPEKLKEIFIKGHKGEQAPAYLLELWLVEEPLKDKSFSTFKIKVPKGTAFGVAQFTNRDYYDKMVESGTLGFSVEANYSLELEMSEEDLRQIKDEERIIESLTNLEKMEEGQEFEINGVMYVVKDGKPVLKEEETEIEAAAEKPNEEGEKEGGKDVEIEKVEAAEEQAPPAPAEKNEAALTKEDVMAMIKEFAQPIIDEAIKTVVEEFAGKEDDSKEEKKDAEMEYAEEKITKMNGGLSGFLGFKKKVIN